MEGFWAEPGLAAEVLHDLAVRQGVEEDLGFSAWGGLGYVVCPQSPAPHWHPPRLGWISA